MRTATADDITVLTDLCFAAIYDDRQWPAVAAQLKSILNGSDASIGMVDTRTRSQIVIYGECEDEFSESFLSPEIDNPTLSTLLYGQVGDIISNHSLVPSEEFRRSAFYNEWLVPQGAQGVLGIKTLSNGRMIATVGVSRGLRQPELDDADIALLRSLSPLLTRVSSMRAQIGALRLGERGSTYDRLGIGIAVLDGNCRLLYLNDAAERVFVDAASGIGVSGGVVEAGKHSSMLRRFVVDAVQRSDEPMRLGGYFSISSGTDGPGHAVTVAPLADAGVYGLPVGRAAIVFIQPLGTAAPGLEARVAALFGATRKEAELAAALAAGDNIADIAETQGISITTARSHLAQLFRKTDTSKQGQLVALLRGILPLGD